MEISWRSPPLVSALHAAEAAHRGAVLADPRLGEAFQVSAQQLAAEIRGCSLPEDCFWRNLIPRAAHSESKRQMVEAALIKTEGRSSRLELLQGRLAGAVGAVETAFLGALPDLANEMSLRERPLREQWEARGAGLLLEIGSLTEESLIAPRCEVLLVHPAQGGGGEAHLAYNSLRIEAVLANAVPELPEIVRLAWLASQLQLDLPAYSETLHADRLPHIAKYAMLPAALAAAQPVELGAFTPQTVELAIATWNLAVPAGINAAALVMEWWQTYQEARPPWRVALAALDQMFG